MLRRRGGAKPRAKSAKVWAEELASLGFNLNFAPVLDINSNPANPVIGERAFGRTPEEVISAALPFIEGMESHGVKACGKHFPGHGDTKVDSHYELPVLDLSPEELEVRELKPFVAAIRAGIGMIMTSHIVFTAIDKENPTTLRGSLRTTYCVRNAGSTASSYPTMSACTPWTA